MSRKNNLAAIIDREVQKRLVKETRVRMQMSQDAAFFAANEVLELGPGRAQAFGEAYIRYVNEMAELIVDDSQDDRAIEYSKHVIDRKLSGIVGEENFKPFDVRYGRRE